MEQNNFNAFKFILNRCLEWIGCICLAIQFYTDPKYCSNTYSAFEWDTWWLRFIFCLHEFFFMMHAWNFGMSMQGLLTFERVLLANILERMTTSVTLHNIKTFEGTEKPYSLEELIFDYRQITIVTDRLNEWMAYKILFFHIISYCQFVSNVFVGMQILRSGGSFGDIW